MQLTLTSIGSIIVFSFCFAGFLGIALKSDKLLSRVKYELLLVCLTAPIMRILIPMEILPWTQNINVPYILPDIVIFVNKTLFTIGTREITIWESIITVLLISSTLYMIWTIISYWSFQRDNQKAEKVDDPRVYRLIEKILAEKGKKVEVTVRWTDEYKSPTVFGLLKPTILMPREELSEKDLENVLRHEIAHYLHGDLIMRFIWILIKSFCWWNPAVYILDSQLEKLLEIRADENALVKKDTDFQDGYMASVISLARNKSAKKAKFNASFHEEKGLSPRKRINIILDRSERKLADFVGANVLTCLVVIGLTVAMNCLIFEPISRTMKDDEEYTSSAMVSEGNSFLVKNSDGTYDMYYYGVYCATLDSNRGSRMPVYESLEEALKYEEIK